MSAFDASRLGDYTGLTQSEAKGARRRQDSRPQRELLRAPIEYFRHVKLILRGTCHLVNPAEFFQGLAAAAEPSQDLAVEGELIDPAGLGI